MTRRSIGWLFGSAVVAILGFVLAGPLPTVGTVIAVVGILSVGGFLLHVWRVANRQNDQWIWQTPGKPRREHLAERAATRDSASNGTPPEAHG